MIEISHFLLQKKIYKGNFSCWLWPVGYIYTNLLKEVCLHGTSADLQKTAFLGFCDCVKEHKGDKRLRGAGLLDLLSYRSSPDDRKYQRFKFPPSC